MQRVGLGLQRRDVISLQQWIHWSGGLVRRHGQGRGGFGQLRIVFFQFLLLLFEVCNLLAYRSYVGTLPGELCE